MRRKRNPLLHWQTLIMGLVPALLAQGCARDLIFTTYTTIGVELKGAAGEIPTSVRLAYKRFEGAIVPVDPRTNAKAHSVLASIDAEQSLWRVRINQVFATGKAAERAAKTEKAAAKVGGGPMARAIKALKAEGTP